MHMQIRLVNNFIVDYLEGEGHQEYMEGHTMEALRSRNIL